MKKIVVTGGAGFIGSHLVKALVRGNNKVSVVDNFSTGRKENLQGVLKDIKLHRFDVRNFQALRKALQNVSCVFHLAAVSSVPLSVDDPLTTGEVNVTGTWNVLEASRLNKVKRVVFVSSASVYGTGLKIPFNETMNVRGTSPYASSKLIGEQLCDLYWNLYNLETVALRFFSVYGPRQNPYSHYANVIPSFTTKLITGQTPTIYGDGKQTRDFVYVGDIVRAFIQASRRKNAVGQIINIGSGKQVSIKKLLSMIQKILNTNIKPRFSPLKPGDDPHTCANSNKAKKLLGINKYIPFEEGLKKTVLWFDKNLKRNG